MADEIIIDVQVNTEEVQKKLSAAIVEVQKLRKEQKVRDVDRNAKVECRVGDVTSAATVFRIVGVEGHVGAHDHLGDL